MILALAGGVGGAKLAHGLAMVLSPADLTVVVNTGDDFEHLGMNISPDLDSVMYAMAACSDEERGWGLAGETWSFMGAMERLGGPAWFKLGDKDLATHVQRTMYLRAGKSLTESTEALCRAMGIEHRIIPMSDEATGTIVRTADGRLSFQEYFVREQCKPSILGLEYLVDALPSREFKLLLDSPALSAIILCPSNPVLSIEPILQLRGVRDRLAKRRVPIVAVSPIVAGKAIKGPLAQNLRDIGVESSIRGIRSYYGDLLDGFVVDVDDRREKDAIRDIPVLTTTTVMRSEIDRRTLAGEVLNFARGVPRRFVT